MSDATIPGVADLSLTIDEPTDPPAVTPDDTPGPAGLDFTDPPAIPAYRHGDALTAARLEGYSWPEINDHLDGRYSAAMAEGYTKPEIDAYLGIPSPAPLNDQLRASWAMAMADDPSASITPPAETAPINPLDGPGAARIADHAGQQPPDVATQFTGEEQPQAEHNFYDQQARDSYAEALLKGEAQTPRDFAERYAGAFWGAAADHGLQLDAGTTADIVRASKSLAATLPTNEELTDTAIAIAADTGRALTPDAVATIKDNLVEAWRETGEPPFRWYQAMGADPDLVAKLVEPRQFADTMLTPQEALGHVAEAFVRGNIEVWNAPTSQITKSIQELQHVASDVGIMGALYGPLTSPLPIAAGAAEIGLRAVNGVIAGVLAGSSQLLDEILGDRVAALHAGNLGIVPPSMVPALDELMARYLFTPRQTSAGTPEENAQVGVKMMDALMTTLAHVGLSGGPQRMGGIPTGRLEQVSGGPIPRTRIGSLRATPEDFANAAAEAAVGKVFDDAQKILDAQVTVVDPLKPGSELSQTMPAEKAYASSPPANTVAWNLIENGVSNVAERLTQLERGVAKDATSFWQRIANWGASDILPTGEKVAEPIQVWHASPHVFDKFDINKIGGGEGTQDEGHGLYFAENRAVHERYLDTLKYEGDDFDPANSKHIASAALDYAEGDRAQAIKDLQLHPDDEVWVKAAKLLERGENPDVERPVNSYKVNLHIDPKLLLDRELPVEEQPTKVQAAIEKVHQGIYGPETTARGQNAGSWFDHIRENVGDKEASDLLQKEGLHGFKYLDSGSAASKGYFPPKETPTYNYGVFHDARIEALERNGERIDPAKIRGQVEAMARGYDASNAIWAHFHNLMIDESGGGSISALFRTPKQALAKAGYAAARDYSQAIIRQFRGRADRFVAANAAQLDEYRKVVNQHVPEYERLMAEVKIAGPGNAHLLDGNPLHEMLKFIEGRSLGATMDPASPLYPVADALRSVNMNMRAQIEGALPDMRSFRDDYYRHLWKNPDPDALDQIFGVGKQGSGASLQKRTLPTLTEGIERGLTPKIINPIDNTIHYITGMANHLAAKQILKASEAAGYVKYTDVPSDWVKLSGVGAERIFAKEATKAQQNAVYETRKQWANSIGKPDMQAKRDAFDAATQAAKPTAERQFGYAHPGFARSYNYWVGKGFYGMPGAAPWYTKMQYFSNAMTGLLLALPGYHFSAIAQEAAVNALSTGLAAIGRGQMQRGLTGIGMGVTVAPEIVRQTLRGREFYKQWLDIDKANEAFLGKGGDDAMSLFTDAGGRMGSRQNIYRFGEARSIFKSVAEGSFKQEVVRDWRAIAGTPGVEEAAIPHFFLNNARFVGFVGTEIGRVFNTFTDPMFDYIIPRVKGAVTFDALESWLKANPTASRETKVAMARRIVNSVDDRLGEMNQDNLFWHPILKQSLNLATVSLGWEYGSLRAAGIAGSQTDTRFTADRLRWLIALPLVNGIMGSVYQALKTHTLPSSFLESQFPAIGNGKHATIPGYLDKDFAQWAKLAWNFSHGGVIEGLQATGDWVGGHGNPLKQSLWDFFRKEDATSNKIGAMPMQALHYPFNQPGIYFHLPREFAQYMSNLWGHMVPILAQKMGQAKAGTNLGFVDRALGFSEAPTWIEDVLNGTNKYQGGRDYGAAKAANEQARRYNRENAQRATPGPPAPVPPMPGRMSPGGALSTTPLRSRRNNALR